MMRVEKAMQDACGRDIYVSENGDVFVKLKAWKDKYGYDCITVSKGFHWRKCEYDIFGG